MIENTENNNQKQKIREIEELFSYFQEAYEESRKEDDQLIKEYFEKKHQTHLKLKILNIIKVNFI
jgi:flagellin-specific chaperone FliS